MSALPTPADPEPEPDPAAPSPRLELDGFSGPLDTLLTLARARRVDLTQVSLAALIDQLATALRDAPPGTPLGQKGDWVVMAAWLVQLRSLLLLPPETPAQQAAETEAAALRDRLVALQAMRTLAAWLDTRPQLGLDVFPNGAPEVFGTERETDHQVDVVEFLWASLTLFEETPGADTTSAWRPPWFDLHAIPDARTRILRRLAARSRQRLDQLLPPSGASASRLRQRSAWAATFAASLELAKQGRVVLEQDDLFAPIRVSRTKEG
jgi:segregation and condensation protein A